jgi:hypothetical protein
VRGGRSNPQCPKKRIFQWAPSGSRLVRHFVIWRGSLADCRFCVARIILTLAAPAGPSIIALRYIMLESIANNAGIDVIWDKWQETLEPLRKKLNTALKKKWEEWEVPRKIEDEWSDAVKKLHPEWWRARRGRQAEIDASIDSQAEYEDLRIAPFDDIKRVRVAGPFTVESLSPHRMLGVDENDDLIDRRKFHLMLATHKVHWVGRATTLAVCPWLRRRFSLHTLLIATTLVAVVLGLAVYAARH